MSTIIGSHCDKLVDICDVFQGLLVAMQFAVIVGGSGGLVEVVLGHVVLVDQVLVEDGRLGAGGRVDLEAGRDG